MRPSFWISFLALTWASIPCLADDSITRSIWLLDQPWVKLVMAATTPPDQCRARAVDLIDRMDVYRGLAKQSESSTAKSVADSMLRDLHRADQSGDECFKSLAYVYLGMSLKMLSTTVTAAVNEDTENWLNDNRNYSFAAILDLLFKNEVLVLLTPSLRKTLGPAWDLKVMGAYQCADTVIFIDPFRSPLDLGGTLAHEIDHLIRDKLTPALPAGVDPAEYLLFDEYLAATQGAYAQFLLNSEYGVQQGPIEVSLWPYPITPNTKSAYQNAGGFRVRTDRTLYSPSGNFVSLMAAFFGGSHRVSHDYSDYYDATFGAGPLSLTAKLEAIRDHLQTNMLELLDSAYFDQPIKVERPQSVTNELKSLDPRPLWAYAQDSAVLTGLAAKLTVPSTTCRALSEAPAIAKLGSYYGTKLGKSLIDRGGIEGIRPGVEGTRPGIEGTRPGIEGTRPELSIRPCLLPPKRF